MVYLCTFIYVYLVLSPLIPLKHAQSFIPLSFLEGGNKKGSNESCGKKLKISTPVSLQDDEINQQSQLAEKLKQQMLDQEEVRN